MIRVVCIGNRFDPRDAAGPLVYDALISADPPPNVEIIEGGLAGLDLLRFLEQADRVVFVDAVADSSVPAVVVLDPDDIAANADADFGHAAGLAYALRMAPSVCEPPLPEMMIVGVEGVPNQNTVAAAAELSLKLAADGLRLNRMTAREIQRTTR